MKIDKKIASLIPCPKIIALSAAFALSSHLSYGAVNSAKTTATAKAYIDGNKELVAYTGVPDAATIGSTELPQTRYAASDKYVIKARLAGTSDPWVKLFTHKTHNRAADLGGQQVQQNSGATLATGVMHYLFFTSGWSHSFANIEMTPDTPIEVEVSAVGDFKIRDEKFFKAAIYPSHKASTPVVNGNKVYFTIYDPAQVTIDINGNMDDYNKAYININDTEDVRHTVSLFANPIMADVPASSGDTNVLYLNPGDERPSDALTNKTTLYFKPGVHRLGLDFKLRPGKKYYIPGDAVVFGTFNNNDVPDTGGLKAGQDIKIFGYGTISGGAYDHPNYVPGYSEEVASDPGLWAVQDHYKVIIIRNALNTEVNGITIVDPANHSCNIAAWGQRPDKSVPATFMRWAKVISWRANGDGFGNQHLTEDCFIRTNDDAGYIKGSKYRCTYWKDTAAAVFHMSAIPSPSTFFPIKIEDCDLIYSRVRTESGTVGGVFHNRAEGVVGQFAVDVTVDKFRMHDKLSNRPFFHMFSKSGESQGQSYSGITFRNITIPSAYTFSSGTSQTLTGSEVAPWSGITFENVNLKGSPIKLSDFSTNGFTTGITINNGQAYAASKGWIKASTYLSESHPTDDFNVRRTNDIVGYIQNGNSITFPDFDFADGVKSFAVKAASVNGGRIDLYVDNELSHNKIGSVDIAGTGGFKAWQTFSMNNLLPVKGLHTLIMRFVDSNGINNFLFDLDDFIFTDLSSNITASDRFDESHPGDNTKIRLMTAATAKTVEYIKADTWVAYSEFDFGDGASSVSVSAATPNAGGSIEFRLGSETGTLIGTVNVTNTDGWQIYQPFNATLSVPKSATAGTHLLYLVFKGSGTGNLFNLKTFRFDP